MQFLNNLCHQALALLDLGYSSFFGSLELKRHFWEKFLLDYPGHPACDQPDFSNPLSIYGDEGTSLGQSTMALSWMSELSPHKTDSVASRFLYTVVPAVDYCMVDGVPLLRVCIFKRCLC